MPSPPAAPKRGELSAKSRGLHERGTARTSWNEVCAKTRAKVVRVPSPYKTWQWSGTAQPCLLRRGDKGKHGCPSARKAAHKARGRPRGTALHTAQACHLPSPSGRQRFQGDERCFSWHVLRLREGCTSHAPPRCPQGIAVCGERPPSATGQRSRGPAPRRSTSSGPLGRGSCPRPAPGCLRFI